MRLRISSKEFRNSTLTYTHVILQCQVITAHAYIYHVIIANCSVFLHVTDTYNYVTYTTISKKGFNGFKSFIRTLLYYTYIILK